MWDCLPWLWWCRQLHVWWQKWNVALSWRGSWVVRRTSKNWNRGDPVTKVVTCNRDLYYQHNIEKVIPQSNSSGQTDKIEESLFNMMLPAPIWYNQMMESSTPHMQSRPEGHMFRDSACKEEPGYKCFRFIIFHGAAITALDIIKPPNTKPLLCKFWLKHLSGVLAGKWFNQETLRHFYS